MPVTEKFKSLIGNVYNSLNKDPDIFEVFRVTYSGVEARYTIIDEFLRIQSTDPALDDFYIDLRQETLQSLVTLIEANARYTVDLIAGFATFSNLNAATLIERNDHTLLDSHEKKFFIFTSFLWIFYKAIALDVQITDDNFVSALRQMNILTAEEIFEDHWARDYYNEVRLDGEEDFEYGRRTIENIIKPKINDLALEEILSMVLLADLNPAVTVHVRTHPLMVTNDFCNGKMIEFGVVTEPQARFRDFDVPVARMIGTVGVLNEDFLNLPGTFEVSIVTDGSKLPLTNAEIEEHIERYKASGKRFILKFPIIIDEGDVGPPVEDESLATNIFEEGVYYKSFWLIRDDFSHTRDDFDNSRRIYRHAQSDHDETP